jgi:hypothetical protein
MFFLISTIAEVAIRFEHALRPVSTTDLDSTSISAAYPSTKSTEDATIVNLLLVGQLRIIDATSPYSVNHFFFVS